MLKVEKGDICVEIGGESSCGGNLTAGSYVFGSAPGEDMDVKITTSSSDVAVMKLGFRVTECFVKNVRDSWLGYRNEIVGKVLKDEMCVWELNTKDMSRGQVWER